MTSQKTKSKENGATVEKQILAIWYVVIARTAQYNPYYLPEDFMWKWFCPSCHVKLGKGNKKEDPLNQFFVQCLFITNWPNFDVFPPAYCSWCLRSGTRSVLCPRLAPSVLINFRGELLPIQCVSYVIKINNRWTTITQRTTHTNNFIKRTHTIYCVGHYKSDWYCRF